MGESSPNAARRGQESSEQSKLGVKYIMEQMTRTETAPTHQQIERRAREIYEQNGRVPGRDLNNWLQAETELSAGHRAPVALIGTRASATPVLRAVDRRQ